MNCLSNDPSRPRRLSDLEHTDELNRMKFRLYALETAVSGARSFDNGDERDGVLQLICDLAEQMRQCAEAFEAERKLRTSDELDARTRLGKGTRRYPVIVAP